MTQINTNYDEDPYDDEDVLGRAVAVPVRVVKSGEEKIVAPEYCSLQTWTIPQWNVAQPAQILTRQLTRYQSRLFLQPTSPGSGETIVPAPAVDTSIIYTNNTGVPQTLQSLRAALTTDATVGNRFAAVQIKDASGNILFAVSNGTATPASTTVTVTGYVGATQSNSASTFTAPLPGTVSIPVGGTVTILGQQGATADQWSSAILTFTGSTPAVWINSKPEPLVQPNGPFGFLLPASTLFVWESQEPCYVICVGSGVSQISVEDQIYAV